MGQLANTPTWGFLVKAPVEQVRETLASFGEEFIFRTNNGWIMNEVQAFKDVLKKHGGKSDRSPEKDTIAKVQKELMKSREAELLETFTRSPTRPIRTMRMASTMPVARPCARSS